MPNGQLKQKELLCRVLTYPNRLRVTGIKTTNTIFKNIDKKSILTLVFKNKYVIVGVKNIANKVFIVFNKR